MGEIVKVDDYFISNQTMVIEPNYDPIYQTKIREKDQILLCKKTPLNIIDSSCIRQGGATMDGRKRAVEIVTKKKVMIPIPIDPSKGIIFMPTKKFRDPDCEWIAYCHIKAYEQIKDSKNQTKLVFYNNDTYLVDLPLNRTQNQIMLAGHVFGHFLKDQYIS
ncbi:competence protein ComK [Tenuibacillus multivorans]|uniref:Competence protein ComK n=1 Tax=Tenuibacillus multivorans TaxID=237069 RepID=A0A1G9X4Y7_9BACI|nr:competence protein ComK [Tenuibacillus multivorans]GEL77224.1 hypothetical protein TMU01_14590 [Tenuibacillus multivorans]SDM91810.1 competence protein ComK [Tenuibacillus multivorans]